MVKIQELYSLEHTLAKDYLLQYEYPWQALKGIHELILQLIDTLDDHYKQVSEGVYVHETAKIYPNAYLGSPCIIGPRTEVELILQLIDTLDDHYKQVSEGVYVHETAKIYPNAYLGSPCIIGPRTEVRPGAFIRQDALVGADCVVGNSTELKNVILFDHVQVPHYNYVSDQVHSFAKMR